MGIATRLHARYAHYVVSIFFHVKPKLFRSDAGVPLATSRLQRRPVRATLAALPYALGAEHREPSADRDEEKDTDQAFTNLPHVGTINASAIFLGLFGVGYYCPK